MRLRNYLKLLLFLALFGGLNARLVDEQKAEEVAINWQTYQLRDDLTIDKNFPIEYGKNTVLYAITFEENKGFVFVSGNDATIPILGYSRTGTLPETWDNPEFNSVLDWYKTEIDYVTAHDLDNEATIDLWNDCD